MTDKEVLEDLIQRERETHKVFMRHAQCFPGPTTSRKEIYDLMDELTRINAEIEAVEERMSQDTLHVTQVNITEIQEAGANE